MLKKDPEIWKWWMRYIQLHPILKMEGAIQYAMTYSDAQWIQYMSAVLPLQIILNPNASLLTIEETLPTLTLLKESSQTIQIQMQGVSKHALRIKTIFKKRKEDWEKLKISCHSIDTFATIHHEGSEWRKLLKPLGECIEQAQEDMQVGCLHNIRI